MAVTAVKGKCPACGRTPLWVQEGTLQCDGPDCTNRFAADKVLKLDHRHVAEYRDSGVSIEHPVTCRLDGKSLHDCPTWNAVQDDHDTNDVTRGRYYVELGDDGLPVLEPLPVATDG